MCVCVCGWVGGVCVVWGCVRGVCVVWGRVGECVCVGWVGGWWVCGVDGCVLVCVGWVGAFLLALNQLPILIHSKLCATPMSVRATAPREKVDQTQPKRKTNEKKYFLKHKE